ncbi:hypothetical protein [Pseudomonas silesiensis]|uniref:hypothetical protein n=1 Tax=Pseudomonas silesiensis TaxID=1853130 RepID=UPI0030D800DD
MTILVPSTEESMAFFAGAQLAPLVNKRSPIRSFAALGGETVAKSDLLIGNDTPVAIGFTDNLDEEKKNAAADSIHFAERYADTYSDRKKTAVEWHTKYAEALKHCGWTLTNSKYQEQEVKQTNVTMDAIVLDLVKAVAGRNAPAMLAMLGQSFDKMKSDEELVTLFDSNSKSGNDADFRLVPCLQTPGGTAIAAFVAVDCNLSTSQGGAWFWKWKFSNLKMKRVATMIELNLRMYERRKDQIMELLDISSDEFFKSIKLN